MTLPELPPDVLSERVRQRVHELFAPSDRETVIEALRQYPKYEHRERPERIHLDILQICDASIERVRALVELANKDYRDLIMAAEYSKEGKRIRQNPCDR